MSEADLFSDQELTFPTSPGHYVRLISPCCAQCVTDNGVFVEFIKNFSKMNVHAILVDLNNSH